MASIGHVMIGVAASRVERTEDAPGARRRYLPALGWSLLSLLPDADVIGFPMGVRYEDAWGHRGATHSFAFAVAVAAVVSVVAPWLGRGRLRTGVLAALVLASHPVLDALTDGGLGCALFWPFDLTRYFAPWQPIPVAPIGLAFLSQEGLIVSAVEVVLFAPLLWLAIAYRRRPLAPRLTVAIVLIAVSSLAWYRPARDGLIGAIIREDTVHAAGFSEAGFNTISVGDTLEQVQRALGAPLQQMFFYPPTPTPGCYWVHLQDGIVLAARDRDSCGSQGVVAGQKSEAPPPGLGPPAGECWAYTSSPGRRLFRARGLCFENGRVVDLIRQWLREEPEP